MNYIKLQFRTFLVASGFLFQTTGPQLPINLTLEMHDNNPYVIVHE